MSTWFRKSVHDFDADERRRWAHVRRKVFARAGWKCQSCEKYGWLSTLECDHIRPIHLGGSTWDERNLQALCKPCHYAKTRSERIQDPERVRWIVRRDNNA